MALAPVNTYSHVEDMCVLRPDNSFRLTHSDQGTVNSFAELYGQPTNYLIERLNELGINNHTHVLVHDFNPADISSSICIVCCTFGIDRSREIAQEINRFNQACDINRQIDLPRNLSEDELIGLAANNLTVDALSNLGKDTEVILCTSPYLVDPSLNEYEENTREKAVIDLINTIVFLQRAKEAGFENIKIVLGTEEEFTCRFGEG